MNNCDSHEGIMIVWDETIDCGCPLCNMESIFDDLFCAADKLDHEIGGTELAQMPKEIAKKLVGFKKIVQDLGAEKEERTSCAPHQESVNCSAEDCPPNSQSAPLFPDSMICYACKNCGEKFGGVYPHSHKC